MLTLSMMKGEPEAQLGAHCASPFQKSLAAAPDVSYGAEREGWGAN